MTRDRAAFLRNNRTPSMGRLRAALVALGLEEVGSFGSSGNFVFCAPHADTALLEHRISEAVGTEVFVRTRQELADVVTNNPYAGRPGAEVFIVGGPVDGSSAVFRDALGPGDSRPVASAGVIYFVNPTRFDGQKAIVDFERELGVRGTRRTSRVVARVLDMM